MECNRYQTGVMISGIVYLHRITDNRVSGSYRRNLSLFEKLCGSDALPNVAFVTTHWNQLQDMEEGMRNEEQLRNEHWKPFLQSGSQMLRFEHDFTSAWKIINSLPMAQVPLKIQQEMVDQGKPLAATAAGRSLFDWFIRFAQVLRERIRRLELAGKTKTPLKNINGERVDTQKELDDTKAKLKEVKRQYRLLNSVGSSN